MLQKTILIADDHPIFREGLNAIVSKLSHLQVIGQAENGQDAVLQAKELNPDLILMDVTMPIMNGTEAIRMIKQRQPDIKIIALSSFKSRDYIQASLESGASGYVLKTDSSDSMLTAIESVLDGHAYFSSSICDTVLNGFLGNSEAEQAAVSWCRLTVREREVIKLVAEGYKNREIAMHLKLSIKTIEKHRSNLMSKLNLSGASALTAYAIEHCLVII
jgi:DNA-binding NarL/FixJ family response regulator